MKALAITVGIILSAIIIVYVFFINAFSGTTWGGWTPPDVSLQLNLNERNWVDDFEKKNDCKFNYIGLDNGYTEDSIIYMNLYCNNDSKLGKKIIKDGELLTKEFGRSFLSCSDKNRSQIYIQFSYDNVKIEGKKYPVNLKYLYYKNSDSVAKIER
jgi:hypothetical protein